LHNVGSGASTLRSCKTYGISSSKLHLFCFCNCTIVHCSLHLLNFHGADCHCICVLPSFMHLSLQLIEVVCIIIKKKSSQGVYCVRCGATRHSLSERYGLALTSFAMWQASQHFSHRGCWVEIPLCKNTKISGVPLCCEMSDIFIAPKLWLPNIPD